MLAALLLLAAPANAQQDQPQHVATEAATAFLEKWDSVRFEPGKQAPFMGLISHLEPHFSMEDKIYSLQGLVKNPHLSGVTLKMQWQQLHPQPDVVDWENLETLISIAASAGKLVNIGIMPGGGSPEWIYEAGAQKIGPTRVGARTVTAPIPWDSRFMDLFSADIRELGARYADDPRVFSVEVLGHNYNHAGEEMHAPAVSEMEPFGWSREKVLDNWKYWINEYNEAFPKKKLVLIVSQMYRGPEDERDLPGAVTKYFLEQCQGRAILMTHQLQGRRDVLGFGPAMCAEYREQAPNGHELGASLKENPERLGSLPMTIYMFLKAGNPLFLQVWRRDCDDPQYARSMLDAWKKYGAGRTAEECKALLEKEGLYVPPDADVPAFGFMQADLPRTPPPDFPSATTQKAE